MEVTGFKLDGPRRNLYGQRVWGIMVRYYDKGKN